MLSCYLQCNKKYFPIFKVKPVENEMCIKFLFLPPWKRVAVFNKLPFSSKQNKETKFLFSGGARKHTLNVKE